VWDSLAWFCGSECVLCVGQFGACKGELVCTACGTVWSGFWERVCIRWLCGGCVCIVYLCVVCVCGVGMGECVCVVCW